MIHALFHRRLFGVRVVELGAAALLLTLILGVYLTKTVAGRERAEIARAESDIAKEHRRLRLLQAEVARLEQPNRIGHLAQAYLSLGPVPARHEATLDQLALVAKPKAFAPPKAQPQAVAAATDAPAAPATPVLLAQVGAPVLVEPVRPGEANR